MAKQRLSQKERRQQIAVAALQLLAEAGPRGLTLAELGERIGVTDASILRHFEDKTAVIDAAIALFGRLLDEDLVADVEDPMRRLAAFFSRRLAKIQKHPEVLRLAHSDRLRDVAGKEGAARVDQHLQRSLHFVRGCVVQAQDEGQMSADIPTQVWVWIIAGVMRGAAGGAHNAVAGRVRPSMSPERGWEVLEQILSPAPQAGKCNAVQKSHAREGVKRSTTLGRPELCHGSSMTGKQERARKDV